MYDRPTISDLCAGGGLAADGYTAIGARCIGWDLYDQPHYPYEFHQADVLPMLEDHADELDEDALHASFPCQAHTTAAHLRTAQGGTSRFPDLLTPGLEILRNKWADTPWIVENVDDRSRNVRAIMAPAPGEYLVRMCGSMFGLDVQRHRLFLANFPLRPGWCDHSTFPIGPKGKPKPVGVYHVMGDQIPEGGHTATTEEQGRHAMGSRRLLPWNTLKEGFPPAYTSHVGADLLKALA